MLICDEYLTPASLDEAFARDGRAHRRRHRHRRGRDRYAAVGARGPRRRRADPGADRRQPRIPRAARAYGSTTRACGSAPRRRSSAFSTIRRSRARCPACRAARCGSPTTRSAKPATIGGNIVNASPAADGTPPLIAHEAEVELATRRERQDRHAHACRWIEFVTGPGKTALAAGRDPGRHRMRRAARLWRQLREGRPPPLAGDLARLPRGAGEARCRRAQHSKTCGSPSAASARCRSRLTEVEAISARPARSAPSASSRPPTCRSIWCASRTRQDYRREVVRGFMLRGLINAVRRAGADPDVLTPELEAAYA